MKWVFDEIWFSGKDPEGVNLPSKVNLSTPGSTVKTRPFLSSNLTIPSKEERASVVVFASPIFEAFFVNLPRRE